MIVSLIVLAIYSYAQGTFYWVVAGTVIAGLVLVVVVWQLELIRREWQERKQAETANEERLATLFTVGYPVKWPPDPEGGMRPHHTVEIGSHKVKVEVQTRSAVLIRRFSLRPVMTEQGGNMAQPFPVRIVAVEPLYLPHSTIGEIWRLVVEPDHAGGLKPYFEPPLPRDEGEAIYLELDIVASEPWEGYLGFRGFVEDRKLDSRCRLTVRPPTPDTQGSPL